MVILVVASVGSALRGALDQGQLPNPLPWEVPLLSPGILLGYVALPAATLLALGINPLRFFRLGEVRPHLAFLLGFTLAVVAMTFGFSCLEAFRRFYRLPEAPLGVLGAAALATYLGSEFFFRGFLLLPLRERLGPYAVPVSLLPYVAIHLGKPAPEQFLSLLFGLGASVLAVRTGTVLWVTIVHWILGISLYGWIAFWG